MITVSGNNMVSRAIQRKGSIIFILHFRAQFLHDSFAWSSCLVIHCIRLFFSSSDSISPVYFTSYLAQFIFDHPFFFNGKSIESSGGSIQPVVSSSQWEPRGHACFCTSCWTQLSCLVYGNVEGPKIPEQNSFCCWDFRETWCWWSMVLSRNICP